ncbi:ketopantoate reductase [Thalassolituus maritimus]|uniref:2-dehydropantoate 2-reductase n=1 Tax=Thalassolituus maritimus TaxID=484498 RepID=A0A1N7MHW1_9GAMM|nr:2-dehydropantoate 2-reductase [Thalassolituus maritimus]SIS85716.1 ketopantoate reductase [Thalassolituus maritimus]
MKIAVLGAGAIGCYLGAVLSKHHEVTLIGRERLINAFNRAGHMALSDYQERDCQYSNLTVTDSTDALASADLILLTVKCLAVHEAAQQLQAFAAKTTPVISLQNGIGSDDMLRQLRNPVIRGIVGFNVAPMDNCRFHRGTEGDVYCEALIDSTIAMQLDSAFHDMGFRLHTTSGFEALQWAKLQLNLNNAINAVSNLPLKQELETRGYRTILSLAMSELIEVTKQEQLKLPKLTKLPARWIPVLLKAPDSWFKKLASSMLAIDPQARSSMWEDLNNQRTTEIDYINGAVVRAAHALGLQAPANLTLVELIKDIEEGRRTPGIPSEEVLEDIKKRR